MSVQWSDAVLREALSSIPADAAAYSAWWSTSTGRALVDQIVEHVAHRVAAAIRRQISVEIDRDEVVSLLFLALQPDRTLLRSLTAAGTERPWAYLHRCMVNSMLDEAGAFFRRELHEQTLLVDGPEVRSEHPSIESAIAATTCVLQPATPARIARYLEHAIGWMADRAVDGRLSYLHTHAAREPELLALGFSSPQLLALANAAVGSRPDHSRTSLLAAFLLEPTWQPAFSRPHRAVLVQYAKRMYAAEAQRLERAS